MKAYLITVLLFYTTLFADVTTSVVHSSISTYYENKDFENSVQKTDGVVYGIAGDIHYKKSEYKFAYEHGYTQTRQPPLPKDLKTDKLFLRYGYQINDKIKININYIEILKDNLAITDDGKTFGAGISYKINKKASVKLNQYYTKYDDFNVAQSDLNIIFKFKIDKVKFNIKSITKYINIDEENINGFTKNADNTYLTTGVLFHMHYNTYHLGGGTYFGKRVFAVMSDGFKIQHHAMEIDRTYVADVGKTIGNYILRFQYIYQRAKELPANNENVKVKNLRFILNYKF